MDDARQRLAKAAMVPLWTSGYVVGTLATRQIAPLSATFWRFSVAGMLMAAIALATRAPWPRRRAEIAAVAAAGVLLWGVQFSGIFLALDHGVPAGLAALLAGSSPLLVAVLAWLLLGERLDKRQWLGSAIGVAGVVLAVAAGLHGRVTLLGLAFALLGLGGLTAGTLVQRRFGTDVDPRTTNAIQLAVAAIAMAPVAGLLEGFHVPLTAAALLPLAWLTAGLSVGAALIFFSLLRREKGGEATSFLYVVPAVTALASVPVLGQPLAPGAIGGLVLGLIGLHMVSRRRAPARAG